MKNRSSGFTLIEMMVVVALLGIIAGIAAPSLTMFAKNSALSGSSEELLNVFSYAKTEAIKRGSSISICNSAAPTAASPSCVTGTPNWATGWLLFLDADGDGVYDSGETLLQIGHAVKNVSSINVTNNAKFVRFRSVVLAGSSDTTFTLCNSGATARIVTIDKVGRITRELGTTCS
ncbi:GspH/FimT family pseudopilin [Chitinibacter fontanus]|uniref:Type II secretion system protein H n=1 Tax=Chitinibacter fontanus TaxID=1737446 RepID=A0A7D5V991_9NEIS|nr:GspH/FimT family pseudopilin [Chitinibacter fontanus]QLI80760.1 GspH/FimT family pseudopilin [Chitinibacter fontanus]